MNRSHVGPDWSDDPPPARVGGFALGPRLGRRAYRSADPAGRPVVVKLAAPGRPPATEAARTADHPNVARFVAAGEDAGFGYLVTGYAEGETFGQRVRSAGPVPAADATGMAAGAAAGLAHLHGLGWVHGDVTPDNLVVGPDGRVTVIDFDLAVPADAPADDEFRGTPGYAAPELLLGRGRPGPPTDVFGLGAVTYFLLTGKPPYPPLSAGEVVLWLLACDARTTPMPPDVPAGLRSAVRQMLAWDPSARLKDVPAVLAELGRSRTR